MRERFKKPNFFELKSMINIYRVLFTDNKKGMHKSFLFISD